MSATTYRVTGLTCGHCVSAVRSEVSALDGVTEVDFDLEAGGVSRLHVKSVEPLSEDQLAAALDEAGDYRLAAPEPETP